MKEKILEELKEFISKLAYWDTPDDWGKLNDVILKSLDTYADWKIKECLPEKDNDVDGFNRDFRRGFNYCIDQILSNKDKK